MVNGPTDIRLLSGSCYIHFTCRIFLFAVTGIKQIQPVDLLIPLKWLSHQIKFAWKWYDSLGLGKDMWRLTFKHFLLSL